MKNHNSFIFSDITLRRWSFFSLISFLIIRLIGLIPPYFMKQIIDVEIPSNNLFNIFSNIFLFVITPFIVAILQTFFNYITICISRNKGNEIAIQIMKNLLKQPLSFFDNQNSAELLSYSGKESVNYIYFHLSEKPKYYAHIITVGIIFIILFKFSPLIAFLQLLFIPFAILPIKLFSKKIRGQY
jgi:ABC-type multidrug transport system fused ATPase/permease subunit